MRPTTHVAVVDLKENKESRCERLPFFVLEDTGTAIILRARIRRPGTHATEVVVALGQQGGATRFNGGDSPLPIRSITDLASDAAMRQSGNFGTNECAPLSITAGSANPGEKPRRCLNVGAA